jgi:hypothetical protein
MSAVHAATPDILSRTPDILPTLINIKKRSKKSMIQNDPAFDRFWEVYPRHEAKQNAARAWASLKADEALASTIIDAARRHAAVWARQRREMRFVPLAAGWLRGKRWEDLIDERPAPRPTIARTNQPENFSDADYGLSQGWD